jgi:hypothetical protein
VNYDWSSFAPIAALEIISATTNIETRRLFGRAFVQHQDITSAVFAVFSISAAVTMSIALS